VTLGDQQSTEGELMAEIPVERKTGIPWWAYLLGLVVLLGLVIFVMRGCGTPTMAALDRPDGQARILAQGVGTATGRTPVSSARQAHLGS
jgi:hypothetical protein